MGEPGAGERLPVAFEPQPAGTPTPDGRVVDGTWTRTRFDIVLAAVTGSGNRGKVKE